MNLISAEIHYAGSSHRMAKDKALLTIDKKTFIQHIVHVVGLIHRFLASSLFIGLMAIYYAIWVTL